LNGVVAALSVPVAVKLLGFSGYGLLSVYTLLVSYILFADLGVGKNLIRRLSQGGTVRDIRVALGLYLVLCGFWAAVLPAAIAVVPRYLFPVPVEHLAAVRWMVVLSTVEFALGVPASLMQTVCVSEQRFEAYGLYSMASGFIRTGALLAGALVFRSPVAIAALLAARKLVEVVVARKMLGGLPAGAWRPVFDPSSFRTMLRESGTLSVAQILNSTLMSIGSPLVNAAFGLAGLGVYRSAFDLAGKVSFISNGITLVAFPRASRYFNSHSPASAAGRLAAVTRWSAAAYGLIAVVAVFAAPYVLPVVGLKDEPVIRLFALLIVATSLNAHSQLSNELIQASGRYRRSIYSSACALATLAAVFLAAKSATGLLAIGWAWIAAALISACVADGLLLVRPRFAEANA
jgi:O-antigen/teichoic acid export membrane protein